MKVIEYSEIWNDFQFRSPTYIDGHFEPFIFDLVKWVGGDMFITPKYCFSIAQLKWNPSEEDFNFKSIGIRYLLNHIDGLEEWILDFCDKMEKKLLKEKIGEW